MQQALQIMKVIRETRAEHGACTAREVARLVKRSMNLVQGQIRSLESMGYVKVTRMPGSLQLTPKGGKLLSLSTAKAQAELDAHRAVAERVAPVS